MDQNVEIQIGRRPVYADPLGYMKFLIGLSIAEISGLIMVILCLVWMTNFRGGFSWDVSLVFNYHPLFMTIGMLFLYGNAILMYRVMPRSGKMIVKIIHAVLQIAAMAFAIASLIAVFDSHNKPQTPIPNMYSLHSWVGLSAVILFGVQWVVGFVSFLFPKLSENSRKWILPYHKFGGIAIFGLVCAAALMGITEKAFFSLPGGKYSQLREYPEGILIDFYGYFVCIFGIVVLFLVTKDFKIDAKRPPY